MQTQTMQTETKIQEAPKSKTLAPLVAIILISLVSSLAVAGNYIQPQAWVGVLDLFAAAAISVFILRGSAK